MRKSHRTVLKTSNIQVLGFFLRKKYYYDLYKCDCMYFVNLVIKPAKTVKLLIKQM